MSCIIITQARTLQPVRGPQFTAPGGQDASFLIMAVATPTRSVSTADVTVTPTPLRSGGLHGSQGAIIGIGAT